MTAITFDTLAFAKKLEAKGFKAEQAAGVSEALKDALGNADLATRAEMSELTTKADLERVRADLKIEIEKVRLEIEKVKSETLKWYVGIATTQTIAILYVILRVFGKA